MLVRDVMTTNVVSAPSSMSIYEAKKIMQTHNIRRLPIVDKGRLIAIVSMDRLDAITPPASGAQTVWELNYQLAKSTLKEVMEKNLVTVSPDMTVEEALAVAQGNKVGALLVVTPEGALVGIATTNDFFYKIVNPIMGLGKPGVRLFIPEAGEGKELEEVITTINRRGVRIRTLFPIAKEEGKKNDLIVHLDTTDQHKVDEVVLDLKDRNYLPSPRKR
ncbi:MAG: CBS domain-containing protein [Chloroflexi bacterium]|nr:CBS domain-containing protein [Chloroflexota bacterium]